MEDGFSLLREWLSPHVESLPPAAEMVSPNPRSLAHALRQVLLNAVMDGARDVDIRTFPDPITGRFTVVEFSHAADGPDFTQLKVALAAGEREADPCDWTQERAALPVGPPGCVLTLWRTHALGSTLETWLMPDGTAEIRVVSENSLGQRIAWFLPVFEIQDLESALPQVALRTNLRLHINDIPFSWPVDPPGTLESVTFEHPWGDCTLYQLTRPDGEIRLYYQGFEMQRQPCPIPFLHFDWNSRFRLDSGNAGDAVTRDFLEARRRLQNLLDSKKQNKPLKTAELYCESSRCESFLDILEPRESFGDLLRLWKDFRRFYPELKKTELQLGFLHPVFPEHWPLVAIPGTANTLPLKQSTRTVALPPDFPETQLPVLSRLQFPHPEKPCPDSRTALILAVNHPFSLHVFSIAEPKKALYLLFRLFLLRCHIEPSQAFYFIHNISRT